MKPKEITIFIDWYLPGYKAGGPIRSCANMIDQLKDKYYFSIITRDTDFGETKAYSNIKSNQWNEIDEYHRVYYVSNDQLTKQFIKTKIEESSNTIYLNSLFSKFFTIYPLQFAKNLNKKIVLAPRGMLGLGALSIKPLKKKVFITGSKIIGLFKNVTWHASAEKEKYEIENVFGKNAKIKIAQNLLPKKEITFYEKVKSENHVNLFFLSRIAVNKNLEQVLNTIEKVDSQYHINLRLIGPIEQENYWLHCKNKINELNKKNNIKIEQLGPIPNSQIASILKDQHFLFLPSYSENFGHAVIESFTAFCPVILSDQTPWRNLLPEKLGWDIALKDEFGFINAVETAAKMNQEEFTTWSKAVYNKACILYNDTKTINDNLDLFHD